MPDSNQNARVDPRDVAAGVLLTVIGAKAALQARAFDDESRMFPLFVAILLAFTGIAIAAHAVLRPAINRGAVQNVRSAVLAALILAAWAVAFAGGAGFVIPTFLTQAALLWLGGFRRPMIVIGVAAIVTLLAYVLFVALLDIPMPPSLLPAALQEF